MQKEILVLLVLVVVGVSCGAFPVLRGSSHLSNKRVDCPSNYTGSCVALGGRCQSEDTCKDSRCENSVCIPYIPVGGACTGEGYDECESEIEYATCYKKVCTKVNYEVKQGKTCDEINDCAGNNICANGICIALAGPGETCSETKICGALYVCDPTTLKCMNPFSATEGQSCENYNCGANLFCSDSKICVKDYPSTPCSNSTCSNSNDKCCAVLQNGTVSQVCTHEEAVTSNEFTLYTTWTKCLWEKSCGFNTACPACVKVLCDASLSMGDTCSDLDRCKNITSSGTILMASLLFVVSTFLVLM